MLPPRKALSAEQLRLLAVSMVNDGDPLEEVADLLDVSERSVWRWLSRWRRRGRLGDAGLATRPGSGRPPKDRKSTRLNSSHGYISYAVFCSKKSTSRTP